MERSSASLPSATGNTEVVTCAVCMTDVWEGAKLPCYHKLCVECCNALFASAEAERGDQVSNDLASSECVCTGLRKFSTPRCPFCRFVVCADSVDWSFLHCVAISQDNRNSSSGTEPQNVGGNADALGNDGGSGNGAGGSANGSENRGRNVPVRTLQDDEVVFLGMTRGIRRRRSSARRATRGGTARNTRNQNS